MTNCTTHHNACDCRQARADKIEDAAKRLAGAFFRLQEFSYDYDSYSREENARILHLVNIATDAMDDIRILANMPE